MATKFNLDYILSTQTLWHVAGWALVVVGVAVGLFSLLINLIGPG